MDHTVSAITRLFSRVNFTKNIVLILLTLLLSTEFSVAQKKSKKSKQIEISAEDQEKLSTYFFEGVRQKNIDNNEAAIKNFLKVLTIDPNHDAAHYELGLLYVKQKNYSLASSSFQKASELKPENEWYLKSYANAEEDLGNYSNAEKIYKELLEKYPDRIETYFDLASVKIFQDDLKGANKVYDQIEKKIGVNEDVALQKQKIWLKLGNVEKAAGEARRLVEHQPLEMRYRMNLAEIYLSNGQYENALKVLDEILVIDPQNGFAQLALADYYRDKKDDVKSYEYLKAAFANPSLNIDQKVRILSPYFSALSIPDIKQKAFELSKLATIAHPDEAKAFAIYADFLYQDKQLDLALEAYQKTVSLDKKVFAVWQNIMFIEIEKNDYASLLKTTDEAVQLFPAQQMVHYLNAVANAQSKNYEAALTSYKNALSLGVNNPETEAQIYSGMGDAYHSLGKHTESDEYYDKALVIKPEDPYVLNNYAYYLSLRNVNLEKSLSMSKKSNELLKDNSSFLDTYAWIFFRMGKYDEALVWIDKAIAVGGSKSATIVEHRGDILFMLNRKEEALVEWNNAATLTEPSSLLKRKISEKKYYE